MKYLSVILAGFAVALLACGSGPTSEGSLFGSAVDTSLVMGPEDAVSHLGTAANLSCTVTGTVEQVCQAEGCWLKLKMNGPAPLLVRTREHSFKVPKDIAGRMVYVSGTVHWDTTDVETLRDYAKDEGKPDSIVATINEPEIIPVVEADGIFVR